MHGIDPAGEWPEHPGAIQVGVGGTPGTATLTYRFEFRIADGLPYEA